MRPLPGRLVLLGHPVAHSLSPAFQNAALRAAGIPLVFEALDVPPDALLATLRTLTDQQAAGNLTIPHKEAAFRACTRRSDVAERCGAVNTFWVDEGTLVGDNTDVAGFETLARQAFGGPVRPGLRIALLGAGGAASAAIVAMSNWADARVTVHARTPERARALADRFPVVVDLVATADAAVAEADVVVNATPLGLREGDALPVDPSLLLKTSVVLDLVYRRGETRWVRAARDRGHVALDGLPMLLEQGAVAFTRWLGQEPDRAAMRAAVA